MKDIILDRLSKMEDLEQRRLLKKIMTGLFLNLVEYQEEMNSTLEQRIFSEIENREEQYDIYVTLCPKDEVDPVQEFLHPMISQDIENKTYDLKEMATKLSQQEEVILLTVFLQCDYLKIKELLNSSRAYSGAILTATKTYQIRVRLKQNTSYLNEIEKLYHIFQKNSIPWKTVNNPYVNKYFDVILENDTEIIAEDEEILEITVNLEEYDQYKLVDLVPLWNIEKLAVKTINFPVPAQDRINFEHVLPLRKMGLEHGYLVNGAEQIIKYIKHTPAELVIIASQAKEDFWDVLKIIKPVTIKLGTLAYPLISNSRKNSLINRFAQKQAKNIRTKGEIARLVHSFEISKHLQLEQVEIKEQADQTGQTYNMNLFIDDNVRVDRDKKVMLLIFRTHDASNFITRDLMSFLVSELQLYFPEYRCEGKLI